MTQDSLLVIIEIVQSHLDKIKTLVAIIAGIAVITFFYRIVGWWIAWKK